MKNSNSSSHLGSYILLSVLAFQTAHPVVGWIATTFASLELLAIIVIEFRKAMNE